MTLNKISQYGISTQKLTGTKIYRHQPRLDRSPRKYIICIMFGLSSKTGRGDVIRCSWTLICNNMIKKKMGHIEMIQRTINTKMGNFEGNINKTKGKKRKTT